uniref:Antimicrobial peptide NK-lysin-like n=1 Tax=Fundulus heteroclitus TaxID=8078 RepID=A0A3Q2NPG2_FUNHE
MKICPFLLLCIFLACSVWMIQGRNLQVDIDDDELAEPNAKEQGILLCKGCKEVVKWVKKKLGPTKTVEAIKKNLKAVCDNLRWMKSKCHKVVDSHLNALIKELMTTDDVRTSCVKIKMCKPKEQLDMIFHPNKEESRRITIIEVP